VPDFLSDPLPTLYLFLAAITMVAGLVWLNRRTRRTMTAFWISCSLLSTLGLIDIVVESPREAAVRSVRELSQAANERNWDKFDARVSNDFEYRGLKKADLRVKLASVLQRFDARTAVWNFDREKVIQTGNNQVEVVFDAKGDPKTGAAYYTHLKAVFIREQDGQWRLKTLKVYPYVSKTNGPEETIPGIP
jgi:ketosteroid isomerase-like protein